MWRKNLWPIRLFKFGAFNLFEELSWTLKKKVACLLNVANPKDIQIAKELLNTQFWSLFFFFFWLPRASLIWWRGATNCKALPGIFSFVFPALLPAWKETCFQQVGSSAVEGTSQAVVGSSDQRKVPASLSLFLKSEKISALLYVGKGPQYRPFRDFRPVPLAYRLHERACTQALLLYVKTRWKFYSVLLTLWVLE